MPGSLETGRASVSSTLEMSDVKIEGAQTPPRSKRGLVAIAVVVLLILATAITVPLVLLRQRPVPSWSSPSRWVGTAAHPDLLNAKVDPATGKLSSSVHLRHLDRVMCGIHKDLKSA